MLVYFRSQHDNQSWLAALTSILDASAFVITSVKGESERQARLTFAMARHAVVDLALVLRSAPRDPDIDRLPQEDLAALRDLLTAEGMHLREGAEPAQRLSELRRMYEPYVYSLSLRLWLSIPPWISKTSRTDNWQISAWGRSAGFKRTKQTKHREEGHF